MAKTLSASSSTLPDAVAWAAATLITTPELLRTSTRGAASVELAAAINFWPAAMTVSKNGTAATVLPAGSVA